MAVCTVYAPVRPHHDAAGALLFRQMNQFNSGKTPLKKDFKNPFSRVSTIKLNNLFCILFLNCELIKRKEISVLADF